MVTNAPNATATGATRDSRPTPGAGRGATMWSPEHRSGGKGDYHPTDALRAVDEGFREHGADSLRKDGMQLPGTVKGNTYAKGNAPSVRRRAGRPQRVL